MRARPDVPRQAPAADIARREAPAPVQPGACGLWRLVALDLAYENCKALLSRARRHVLAAREAAARGAAREARLAVAWLRLRERSAAHVARCARAGEVCVPRRLGRHEADLTTVAVVRALRCIAADCAWHILLEAFVPRTLVVAVVAILLKVGVAEDEGGDLRLGSVHRGGDVRVRTQVRHRRPLSPLVGL